MTAPQLLAVCRQAGIELTASGDRLKLNAPRGAVTPELRSQLKRHKAELLPMLSAPAFVTLAPTGLTMPLPVLALAWDLEDRGFRITTGARRTLSVEPNDALTPADRSALRRWKTHLVALSEFCDKAVAI